MIKEILICFALLDMNGVINESNICENIQTLHEVSTEYNIDPSTYVSVLWVESNFTTNINSYTGKACGISQVVPKWTRPRVSCQTLNEDPSEAIKQGARIFSIFKKYGKGSLDISLCGYNQGYRCKDEIEVKPGGYDYRKEGLKYASKVKKFKRRLNRSVRKQKKKFKEYKKKLLRALNVFYDL